jgi:hypothetical protein
MESNFIQVKASHALAWRFAYTRTIWPVKVDMAIELEDKSIFHFSLKVVVYKVQWQQITDNILD